MDLRYYKRSNESIDKRMVLTGQSMSSRAEVAKGMQKALLSMHTKRVWMFQIRIELLLSQGTFRLLAKTSAEVSATLFHQLITELPKRSLTKGRKKILKLITKKLSTL